MGGSWGGFLVQYRLQTWGLLLIKRLDSTVASLTLVKIIMWGKKNQEFFSFGWIPVTGLVCWIKEEDGKITREKSSNKLCKSFGL